MALKVNFLLPFFSKRPGGGIKIMYEYAQRLSEVGWDVAIYHCLQTPYTKRANRSDFYIKYKYFELALKNRRNQRPSWFSFSPKVICKTIPYIHDKYVRDSDISVATWWATVIEQSKLKPSKGARVNLIQGYENWLGYEDLLLKSYDLEGNTNIVVSSYLLDIVKQHTRNRTELIVNGVSDKFKLKKKIESRSNQSVCMMYSDQQIKGSEFGIAALIEVKKKYPALKVVIFGVPAKSDSIPHWIEYHQTPDNLCDIYNSSAIFITNSFTEGFGLPAVEAMSCGCCLICTDIKGHSDFAFENETAVLYEAGNINELVEKLIYLIDNEGERIELALKGNKYVQNLTMAAAFDKFEEILASLVHKR